MNKILSLIKEKRFEKAENFLKKMHEDGNQLYTKCLPKNEIILGVHWKKVLTCLVSTGSSVPELASAIFALKAFEISKLLYLARRLERKAKLIYKSCRKQG